LFYLRKRKQSRRETNLVRHSFPLSGSFDGEMAINHISPVPSFAELNIRYNKNDTAPAYVAFDPNTPSNRNHVETTRELPLYSELLRHHANLNRNDLTSVTNPVFLISDELTNSSEDLSTSAQQLPNSTSLNETEEEDDKLNRIQPLTHTNKESEHADSEPKHSTSDN
jgi:hypothetical protein